MIVTIKKTLILPNVYSASGIECISNRIFVIGDNTHSLYILNLEGMLLDKVPLFDPGIFKDTPIPKDTKPDLETLTSLVYHHNDYLLTLGSGSKKDKREIGFLVEIKSMKTTKLSLSVLYDQLRSFQTVVGNGKLNIEGLASTDQELILLARGNISGKNVMISYDLNNIMDHLLISTNLLTPVVSEYNLPHINGILAGFSGGTYLKETNGILFTASVENTTNEIDDGESLGSFIGYVSLTGDGQRDSFKYCLIKAQDQKPYLGKVESVAIVDYSNNLIRAVAVTDNDGGPSEMLWMDITI